MGGKGVEGWRIKVNRKKKATEVDRKGGELKQTKKKK